MKKLKKLLPKKSGRDVTGKISVRHQGGRQKRFYRIIDWKRDKDNISCVVEGIEYDPNRNTDIALVKYKDGERRYIIAPYGLKIGDKLISGENVDIREGNCTYLSKLPVGTRVHNLELKAGSGAQMVRSAGDAATVLAKEGGQVHIKLPSGEVRIFKANCRATIGQVGNIDMKHRKFTKAGTKRRLGIRPAVRGVAQNPSSHPHGGGEGRSGIGMPSPKSPWGKKTLGKKTRKKKKYSDSLIIKRRK